jgi:hypothetical protein
MTVRTLPVAVGWHDLVGPAFLRRRWLQEHAMYQEAAPWITANAEDEEDPPRASGQHDRKVLR